MTCVDQLRRIALITDYVAEATNSTNSSINSSISIRLPKMKAPTMRKRDHHSDRLESLARLIEFGASQPSTTMAPLQSAESSKLGLPWKRDPSKKIKPLWALGRPERDDDDRRHFAWFTQFCDLYDWHFAAGDGTPYQKTNEQVEWHLNTPAKDWQSGHRLPKLRAFELAMYRRGQKPALHGRPRRYPRNEFVAVRLDFDAHQGQKDAPDAFRWLNDEHFGAKLYDEPSANGWSAWTVFHFAPIGEKDGKLLYPSKARINALMDQLQAALQRLLRAQGFACTVEVSGRFAQPCRLNDGRIVIPQCYRGKPMKLPRCPNSGDAAKLHASQFSESLIHHVIGTAWLNPQQIQPKPSAQQPIRRQIQPKPSVQPPIRRLHNALGALTAVLHSDDKHQNRCRCIRRALKMILGHPRGWPDQLTPEQIAEVIELANTIYESSGMATGQRDQARNNAFNKIATWMLGTVGTYEGSGGAGDAVWFDMLDLKAADDLLRSLVPSGRLDNINKANRKRFGGSRISYFMLALALCTMTKNAIISDGEVPAKSVSGMLRYFGLRHNRSIVAEAMRLIREVGLAAYTCNGSYKPSRWCRRYRPANQAWSLPFVAHLKPQEQDQRIAQQQASRYIQCKSGRGPIAISRNNIINTTVNSEHISMRGGLCPIDDGSCITDPAYWASLDEIAREYEERWLMA